VSSALIWRLRERYFSERLAIKKTLRAQSYFILVCRKRHFRYAVIRLLCLFYSLAVVVKKQCNEKSADKIVQLFARKMMLH